MVKFADALRKVYPDSFVEMELTQAGVDSYKITVMVLNSQFEVLQSLDYYGSGDLNTLKKQALQQLVDTIAVA